MLWKPQKPAIWPVFLYMVVGSIPLESGNFRGIFRGTLGSIKGDTPMARKVVPLSDALCRSAKAQDKDYKLFDGGGLHLVVKVSGSKFWRCKYSKPNGREGLLSFGGYPCVSLAVARKMRDEAKLLLLGGVDPLEHKRKVKAESARVALTFKTVALAWYAEMSRKWSAQHAANVLKRLETYLFPYVGHRPIIELDTHDLLEPLEKLKQRGTLDVASRVQQYVQSIMRDAKRARMIESNPALDLAGVIKPKKIVHRPALPLKQLPDLLTRLDGYQGRELTRLAVLLTLHVFVRSSELRFARWREFDLDRAIWEIPDTREAIEGVKFSTRGTKMAGDTHLVPLSLQAVALLKQIHTLTGRFELVFPGDHAYWKPMSENTVNKALRGMGYDTKAQICGHGFRTMACSALIESNLWSEDAIERQMSHRERNSVRAAYTHKAEFLEQRRMIMAWWSNYLDANREKHITPYEYVSTPDKHAGRFRLVSGAEDIVSMVS